MNNDDFYGRNATQVETNGLISQLGSWVSVYMSLQLVVTLVLALVIIIAGTRLLSERPSRQGEGDEKAVRLLPYWFPVLGHTISVLRDPTPLMTAARDSSHGIFALNMGAATHNIISDPSLVKSVMRQKQSVVEFDPIAWNVITKFFGVSNKPLYDKVWVELSAASSYLMKEPGLSGMLKPTIKLLEQNIPQMVTFIDTDIDLQPWERSANLRYISDDEVEVDLMALLRDLLGHAAVPSMFGSGLLDKYPSLISDVFGMDSGMLFFLMQLPAWFPWPGVFKAHMARRRVWEALDDQQRALDKHVDGEDIDHTWGDMDDISEFIKKRHEIFKNNGFKVKERGDISMLWALNVNANLLVYWQLLHIISNPTLLASILTEIAPHTTITAPTSIGRISSSPTLSISHEGLSKSCPLFKATYLEALRISSRPWSVRRVAADVTISSSPSPNPTTYKLHKGEFITIPHELHMRDPAYFADPDNFIPERFLVKDEADGTISVDGGTMRPFGGGPSMCKGRVFAERECLALVAGVLAFWEFEPVGEKGWVMPEMVKTSSVSRPKVDTRVRVRRRKFEWDE